MKTEKYKGTVLHFKKHYMVTDNYRIQLGVLAYAHDRPANGKGIIVYGQGPNKQEAFDDAKRTIDTHLS